MSAHTHAKLGAAGIILAAGLLLAACSTPSGHSAIGSTPPQSVAKSTTKVATSPTTVTLRTPAPALTTISELPPPSSPSTTTITYSGYQYQEPTTTTSSPPSALVPEEEGAVTEAQDTVNMENATYQSDLSWAQEKASECSSA
jgi:hypothetical protein